MAEEERQIYKPERIRKKYIKSGFINVIDVNQKFLVQRPKEDSRVKIIEKSMAQIGFDRAKPIVITDKNVSIDGKHRLIVAAKLGISKIPYVMYKFETPDDEFRYFQLAQIQTSGMRARDELFAYLQTNHPYATLIYKMCENKKSLLNGGHDLKLKPNHKSSNSNIKVENICYVINGIVFNRKTGWSRTNSDYLATLALSIIEDKDVIKKSIEEVNDFMTFFFNAFGWTTDKKDYKFKEHFLLASIDLFKEFLKPNPIFNSDRRVVESKLSKLPVDKTITKNHKVAIVGLLLSRVNNGRQKASKIYGAHR